MSYELKFSGKIGPRLQKIFDEEVTKAMEHLEGPAAKNLLRGTHAARKHFKKIRALLRLLRDELGTPAYAAENQCFLDAGRKLRDLRDAQVLLNALDSLRKRFVSNKHPPLLTHARKLLAADERRCLARISQHRTLPPVVSALQAAKARGAEWDLESFGWKETRRAIKRSYKRARKEAKRAFADPSVARLHEWRKRVKVLWYHTRLLRKACPDFMKELAHDLEALSEFLGDDHDLAMLREVLMARRDVLGEPVAFAALLKMIDLRRGELLRVAIDLGQRIYDQRATEFIRELDAKRKAHRRTKKKAKKLAPKLRAK